MEISGVIKNIMDTVQVTEKLQKRELWVEIPEGQHPQVVTIEFLQGWANKLDDFSIGDKVKVQFNLRGRIWKDKVYNSLNGYALELTSQRPAAPHDDLPF